MELVSERLLPLPDELVHPFIVCVTVYVPAVVTVIDEVVAPLLHNKEPVKSEAVSTELPQLLTTVTVGVALELLSVQLHRFLKDWYIHLLFV